MPYFIYKIFLINLNVKQLWSFFNYLLRTSVNIQSTYLKLSPKKLLKHSTRCAGCPSHRNSLRCSILKLKNKHRKRSTIWTKSARKLSLFLSFLLFLVLNMTQGVCVCYLISPDVNELLFSIKISAWKNKRIRLD